ncbi:MAG: guanylate kinase [Roseburia sp.]|nr:guanylate kinase [Ruminococcus sp.]MCM1156372.1 guanylate kinase [Roseburia sp.]MCM1242308.1 guanylate kinase [Roseburia sp.]
MGKIVCLMGKSSSGKDSIYKKLLEQHTVSLQKIVPYTTRPIRAGECNGVEYHFTDEAGYRELADRGNVIETRVYNTCHGSWRYFTVADDETDLSAHSYLLIGTLEAYENIRNFYGEEKVLPVMIELDDGIRLQRALDREKTQDAPRYEEMCRRFLADAEDFSKEKLDKAGIGPEQTFHNNDDGVEQCLEKIIKYLKKCGA